MKEAFEIAQAVLLSLGGGAIIIFACSSFLGKVWANRILQSEKKEHEKELSEFKSQLAELTQRNHLNYQEKIDLYKVISLPLAGFVSVISQQGLTQEHVAEFDKQRLHITAQLALFAPLSVFDAFNAMLDYIFDSLEKGNFSFITFREKSLHLLSEMRKDVGIYSDNVSYKGPR